MYPNLQFIFQEYKNLPDEAKNYIKTIEKTIEVPVKWISVGPKREQTIIL